MMNMKKVIIGISAVLISAFVVILAVNAQNNQQETRKSCTEISKDGSKCPAASSCCKMKYGSTAETKECDKSKCKAKSCDPANCKEAKCNHPTCNSAGTASSGGVKKNSMDKTKPGSLN
jgi:hypothetical protein